MSQAFAPPTPPTAVTRRSRRVSVVWIVPLVAIAIGAWLAWDTLSKEGPTIKVTFESAEGLQPGQSQLKYKDIVFGTVKSVDLTPDNWHVVVTIATTREAKPLLTEGAVFWVVKPRLFAGSISGLDTLLSGSYVGVVPGSAGGKTLDTFAGQEDPPLLEAHTPGRTFLLKAPRIGSINVGSPLFFHDLTVGQVLGWDVGDMARAVTMHVFVRAPYDGYISNETRFWDASGLSIKLGSAGVDVKMESLRALMFGGVAFDTPPAEEKAEAAPEGHVFPLFASRDEANSASYTRIISGVSYFPGSVSGLGPGSDVTMHGLKIGRVTDVRLKADLAKGAILAAVHYEVQPERIVGVGHRVYKSDAEALDVLFRLGLRASLQSGNLITGQQVVELALVPDAPQIPVATEDNSFIVPTMEGGGLAGLASSATDVLDKVNKIPFAEIGGSLASILGSVNRATEGPQLKEAVSNLDAALEAARKALTNANKLVASVDDGYGNDTKFHRDLDRLLVQTDDAVRAVHSLADILARHPEALIKGRPE